MNKDGLFPLLLVVAVLMGFPQATRAVALNDPLSPEILFLDVSVQAVAVSRAAERLGVDHSYLSTSPWAFNRNIPAVPASGLSDSFRRRMVSHPDDDDALIFSTPLAAESGESAPLAEAAGLNSVSSRVSREASSGDHSPAPGSAAGASTSGAGPAKSRSVPEPVSILLLGLSIVGLASIGRKRLTRQF